MKAFEEWYKKEHKREGNPNVFYGAELGWKAALEWALSLHSVRINYDVYENIKWELEK